FGLSQDRLATGEVVFLGVIEERAHFALDLSPVEAPLDMLRSPALAASGVEAATVRFADLRQVAPRINRHEGALLALARAWQNSIPRASASSAPSCRFIRGATWGRCWRSPAR